MNLKFHTSVAKMLKLKFRKFWRLLHTFVEVTGKTGRGDLFGTSILTRVNINTRLLTFIKFVEFRKSSATKAGLNVFFFQPDDMLSAYKVVYGDKSHKNLRT